MGAIEVDLAQANTAQTSAPAQVVLMWFIALQLQAFPANPKVVPACIQAKGQLTLVNDSRTPHATKQRRHSPEEIPP